MSSLDCPPGSYAWPQVGHPSHTNKMACFAVVQACPRPPRAYITLMWCTAGRSPGLDAVRGAARIWRAAGARQAVHAYREREMARLSRPHTLRARRCSARACLRGRSNGADGRGARRGGRGSPRTCGGSISHFSSNNGCMGQLLVSGPPPAPNYRLTALATATATVVHAVSPGHPATEGWACMHVSAARSLVGIT
jgi:hypothetical protein